MARDSNDLLRWGDIEQALMEYHGGLVMSKFLELHDCRLARSVAEGALYAVEYVEAVEAEPVRHGRWYWLAYDAKPEIGNWHCSLCNGIGSRKTPYCPNCGARMDGEEA